MADPDPTVGTDTAGWTGSRGFLLATIGSAVGIGSIWKFPYVVGANGGGAFVLVYLAGLALVVVPLMLTEFAVGRKGRSDAVTSIRAIVAEEGHSGAWGLLGVLGAVTAFLVLSFYSVIGGWTLAYAFDTVRNGLPTTAVGVQAQYDELLASPLRMGGLHATFLGLVALVVVRGVQRGIENSMKILMPVLAVLLVVLAGYSLSTGDAGEAARFLFVPDFADMSGRAVLDALGLGFFSIGVGLGILATYAAYSPIQVDLKVVAVASVAADTAISLLAGLAIFPIVFANGVDAASGPGLAFVSLPLAFAAMPGGRVAAVVFFVMLAIAALGSAISMLEAVVAVLDHRFGWRRSKGVAVAATACFVVGLGTVLSFNRWAEFHPLGAIGRYADATVFDLLDDVTSQVLLPMGGLGFAVLVGWVLPSRFLAAEIGLGGRALTGLLRVIRIVAPAVLTAAGLAWLMG